MANTAGPVVPIGGSEDKTGACEVLAEVLALAGTRRPRVAVCASASEIVDERLAAYRAAFARLGAGEVADVTAADLTQAHAPTLCDAVLAADLVFLTGGSQERLMSRVAGTPLADAIHTAHRAGVPVAGTSAGASALTELMPVPVDGEGEVVRLSSGLGLMSGVVVDQHFTERQRLPRLTDVLADHQNAGGTVLVGVGIDEDTAVIFDSDACRVVGAGGATVVRAGLAPRQLSESGPATGIFSTAQPSRPA